MTKVSQQYKHGLRIDHIQNNGLSKHIYVLYTTLILWACIHKRVSFHSLLFFRKIIHIFECLALKQSIRWIFVIFKSAWLTLPNWVSWCSLSSLFFFLFSLLVFLNWKSCHMVSEDTGNFTSDAIVTSYHLNMLEMKMKVFKLAKKKKKKVQHALCWAFLYKIAAKQSIKLFAVSSDCTMARGRECHWNFNIWWINKPKCELIFWRYG